jgi:ABC-2 type transport system ATP-binding protein
VSGVPFGQLSGPRQVVGAVVDRLGAHPGHSARFHLRLIATGTGLERERVDEVLALVGLIEAADRRIATYSTGMKQRLALGAALLGDPEILVLDEPSNGLDPDGVRWMRGLLRDSAASGAAVFMSTHQLAELASVVDRLVVLDAGQVLAEGTVEDLADRTGADSVEQIVFALTDPVSEVPS